MNRKDRSGNNAFDGGFLGLDNIGVFDRSAPLPTGGYLEQADGTAWMALFCQNMMEIAVELAMEKPSFADMSLKFIEHFLWIANALVHAGEGTGMWDVEARVLLRPAPAARRQFPAPEGALHGGTASPCVRPPFLKGRLPTRFPDILKRFQKFIDARSELITFIHDPRKLGSGGRRLASVLDETKLRRVLAKMLDEKEFLSPYGIRSLSRFHEKHPYVFRVSGQDYSVSYLPAESDTGMFGGNSNWRGRLDAGQCADHQGAASYYSYYGNDFMLECPTGSGRQMNLYQVAEEIVNRLAGIFLKDADGRRPVNGGTQKFQEDPHWRDYIQFYEYFHGDNGAGLGANHQTGWTGIIARAMHLFATTTSQQVLSAGKKAAFVEVEPEKKKQRKGTIRGSKRSD